MKKKSVLIIDKQKNMLNIYKNMINWDDYGYEVLAIIDNEKAAISSYGEYLYDLIITDTDLKEGNGLSLISRIKKIQQNVRIVVISQDIDYETVRMAMKLGAYDYFAKSKLRYSDFITLLNELNAMDKNEPSNDEDELQRLMGLIRDKQKIDENRILKAIDIEKYPLLSQPYQMVLFRLDHVWNLFHTVISKEDKEFLHDEVRYELEKTFKDIPYRTLLFSKKHSGIVLIPPTDIEILKNKAKTLLHNLESGTGYTFSLTISTPVHGIDAFYQQYQKTLHYHNWKFYDGDNSVCLMQDKDDFNNLIQSDLSLLTSQLLKINIRELSKTALIKEEILAYFNLHKINPEQVITYFNDVLLMIFNQHYNIQKLRSGDIDMMFLVLSKVETLTELSQYMDQCFNQVAHWLFEDNSNKYKKNVNKILLYIEANLDKKITLEMIANELNLSEIHISRMFKTETGFNLINYINEHKMERALELMANKRVKIKEIALNVGFDNQLYFNKVFKKIYKVSPSIYRKGL